MKRLLIAMLFPVYSYTQQIPDTCFTEQEIIQISTTLDSLWEADAINNTLIHQQHDIINDYRYLIKLDSMQIAYQKQQIVYLNNNIDLYIRRQQKMQPKWYDSKELWFGSGIIATILTAFTISTLIH